MTKIVSQALFHKMAKAGRARGVGLTTQSSGKPKAYNDGSRKIRFCFSDGSVDRMGDVISSTGWVLHSFNKNPVVLWSHDAQSPPIGRASRIVTENGRLMGDVEFASAELNPFADTIFKMAKAGFISATSVGFIPLEWEWSKDKSRDGIDFKKQELLEVSVVPVPANAAALVAAGVNGIDNSVLKGWADMLLNHRGGSSSRYTTVEERRAKVRRLKEAACSGPAACAAHERYLKAQDRRKRIIQYRDNFAQAELLQRSFGRDAGKGR